MCESLEVLSLDVETTQLNLANRIQGGDDDKKLTVSMNNMNMDQVSTSKYANEKQIELYDNSSGKGLGADKGREVNRVLGTTTVSSLNWSAMSVEQQVFTLSKANSTVNTEKVLRSTNIGFSENLMTHCKNMLTGLCVEAKSMDGMLRQRLGNFTNQLQTCDSKIQDSNRGTMDRINAEREKAMCECVNGQFLDVFNMKRKNLSNYITELENHIEVMETYLKEKNIVDCGKWLITNKIEPTFGFAHRFKVGTTVQWNMPANGKNMLFWFKVVGNSGHPPVWKHIEEKTVLKARGYTHLPAFPGTTVNQEENATVRRFKETQSMYESNNNV